MRRAEWLQEVRKMRFEEAYSGWRGGRLTQEEAARILGVSDRTFRRCIERYDDGGLAALLDKRISQVSHLRAPVDEVMALAERYRNRYAGWNVRHFHAHYLRGGGARSYTWVKSRLQEAGLVSRAPRRGAHRKRRERSPWPGMMLHQDGNRHEWVPGQKWDLIVTMDDATGEHYSMFFIDEEGTQSSFQGIRDVVLARGLFGSLYTDRGSHYWHTPEAGGKVDRTHPTQFGRAMRQLGITMIPAYSPEARGRSERAFRTHQDRLPKELALHGINTMEEATRYLRKVYRPAFNEEFMQPPLEEGRASSSGSATTSKTSSASSMTGSSATTTPSPSKGSSSRSRPTGTGATTSRPMCGCIATSIRAWPSSTAQEDWRTTRRTGS